jgi:hypothetical protein
MIKLIYAVARRKIISVIVLIVPDIRLYFLINSDNLSLDFFAHLLLKGLEFQCAEDRDVFSPA